MSEGPLSTERQSLARPLNPGRKGISLQWKVTGAFVGMIALLGLLVVAIIFHLTRSALRTQFDQRAAAITTNLSDAAAGPSVGNNVLELHALVTKYARLEGAAYAFIEDRKGNIVTHSLQMFPPALQQSAPSDNTPQPQQRELRFQGRKVYETRVPILEGQVGTAHMGFWGDTVQSEIQRILFPLVGLVSVVLVVGLLVSAYLCRVMIRPILRLTESADKISRGNLETAVGIESQDEIGNLARSIERLRASLKTAMSRLAPG